MPANSSAGHLSVHFEGEHPVAVPFLFEQRDTRFGPALVASLVYHVAVFSLLIFMVRYGANTTTAAVLPDLSFRRAKNFSSRGRSQRMPPPYTKN